MKGAGNASAFWSGRRVLVTGAGGFVGSHLTEELVARGARVTAAVRREPAHFLDGVRDRIELRSGDLEDAGFCAKLVHGHGTVLHLAAHVGGIAYNRLHHATLFVRNLQPLMNMLEAARGASVERFLVTSSACIYRRDCPIPTPESDGTQGSPEPTNAGYGWAKRMQEYLGAEYAREFSLPVAIARPFNAYGPRDDFRAETSHVIPALIRKVLEGEGPVEVWGSGRQSRGFLYVTDLVEGLLRTAERHVEAEPVNIGPVEETTIGDLVRTILEISGRQRDIVFDTSRPEGQPRRACDTTTMRRVLDWTPTTTLALGLRRTIEWYRDHPVSS